MKQSHYYQSIPKSRIATVDIFSIGLTKHHVSALLEFDVTDSRKKIRDIRKTGINISFNGWLIKAISNVLSRHKEAAAYLYNMKRLIIFNDINISIIVEKTIEAKKVPIPLVLEKTNEKSAAEITLMIEKAKKEELSGSDIVLHRRTQLSERIYYHFPGFIRRAVWRIILRNPGYANRKMGNAIITSVGMIGKINGWFIHRSIHPISFGVGSVLKKAVVVNNEIKIREVLNMTLLADHDLIDGATMVRFLNDLTKALENGDGINTADVSVENETLL